MNNREEKPQGETKVDIDDALIDEPKDHVFQGPDPQGLRPEQRRRVEQLRLQHPEKSDQQLVEMLNQH